MTVIQETEPAKLPQRFKRIKAPVTQEVIDTAIPRDSGHCMIADGLKLAGFQRPEVNLATIAVTDPKAGLRLTYLTSPTCQQALLRFDQGLLVEPFDIYLQRPIRVAKASQYKRQPDGKLAKTPEGKLIARSRRRQDRIEMAGDPKGDRSAPVLVEGKPLPNGVLSNGKGRIRKFGLRQATP